MSIEKRQGGRTAAPTTRAEELQLFVDRHRYVREFITALHTVPPDEKMLFFYGVGGVGKSLLLRYLKEHGCVLLPQKDFLDLDHLSDSEFRASFESASTGRPVPIALHDFSAHVVGDEDPCDLFHGPLLLRAKLGRLGFRFPQFDFAVILFAQRKGFSSEKVTALLPSLDKGVVRDVMDFLVGNTKAGAIAAYAAGKLFEKYGANVDLLVTKRRAPDEQVKEIYGLDMDTELVPRLPRYLALDLTDQLDARRAAGEMDRLCLFFDTHDAFWAEQSFGGSEMQRHARDRWFRTLLRNLDLERTLVVVTGRERPRWATAASEPVPPDYVHTVAVGDLEPNDAALYLTQRGVTSPATQTRIVEALQTETGVHPLSLGLAADLVKVNADGADDLADVLDGAELDFGILGPKLLERLLQYMPSEECHAITALGACRTFDRALYLMLGNRLAFAHSGPAFEEIKRLSFVIPYVEGDGHESFKIHTLLRKSLIESAGDLVQRTHRVLAEHYAASSTTPGDAADLERLFHVSRETGRRDAAVREWLELMQRARDHLDTQLLLRVLGLEDELELTSWSEQAELALGRAALYNTQGRSDDAEQTLRDAVNAAEADPADEQRTLLLAELLLQLGWVERYRTRSEEAEAAFRRALELVADPSPEKDHMRGRLWFGLSGVPSDAGRTDAAGAMLRKAAEAYASARAALGEQTPMRWISDGSYTDTCLSSIRRSQARHEQAVSLARTGVQLAERALAMAPGDHRATLNVEGAYGALAAALAQEDPAEALHMATLAIDTCKRLAASTGDGLERLVRELLLRADLHSAAGREDLARDDVLEAVEVARQAADLKPRHRYPHLLLARSLLALVRLGDADRPADLLDEALAAGQRAVAIAPGLIEAHSLVAEIRRAAADVAPA